MEYVDNDGLVHVEGDRIEGGTVNQAAAAANGVPVTLVAYGAAFVGLSGLLLGYFLFPHGQTGSTTTTTTQVGKPQTESMRDAITREQQIAALNGTSAVAGPPGTAAVAAANPLQPGLPVGYQPGQPGTTPGAVTGQVQRPINPQVALDLASRRAPIMGFAGGNFGSPTPGQQEQGGAGNGARSSLARFDVPGEGQDDRDDNSGGSADRPNRQRNGPSASASQDGLSSQLGHHIIETARATVVGNRSFLLSAGTLVPCTLQTAINSTQAGYVSCVIGHDVYSEDGRVVLLDKGTKVLGQYTGGINQGQARLFVLWTRALTPRGVAIDVGSPASDDLGRAGMSGAVDSQFFQRFGAALMLSVVEDLGAIASSHFANVGSNTTQVPQSTASTALQSTVNIKPVLKKNQGEQVAIFVAKDFDFTPVYDVRIKR